MTNKVLLVKIEKCFSSNQKLLLQFLRDVISPSDSHHITAECTERLAESFAQDLVFAINKGKFLTLKHTSVGLGLHNMTGQKIPIVILSHLGESISYHTVREIETAQAEVAENFPWKVWNSQFNQNSPLLSCPQ